MVPRPATPDEDVPLIPQFFAGRSVLITGGTGFMGKVLVERLLWTCPDIGQIYLLMREKKDVSVEKRLLQLKNSQVFDRVRSESPRQLDKICAVAGDTQQPRLGLQPLHLHLLQQVSIVFHSAATLKFDAPLNVALEQNVLSVMRLMDICDTLPSVEALVHVSTAYCNAELSSLEERVYESRVSVADALAVAKSLSPHALRQITTSFISPKPNTYTFTKALAENAIVERMDRTYPIAIFRPSIVISAKQHPFPGWIENLNGPSGVIVGAGKGLLHVFGCDQSLKADLLPVDIAIDTLIAVAWETATTRPKEVQVYNCSMIENPTSWRDFEAAVRVNLRADPLDHVYWYPTGFCVQSRFVQKLLEMALQTLPLHLAEYVCKIANVKNKMSLITVSSRLSAMADVLRFFSVREWAFNNDNVRRLRGRLSRADKHIYNLDPNTVDWEEHYRDFVRGTRRYLLKEKDEDIPSAKKHLRKMYYVHLSFLCLCMFVCSRIVAKCGGFQLLMALVGVFYRALKKITGS